MPTEWITATEAARRLGVKQASLYSYVSRGVLSRRKADGSRASLFSAREVDSLARRGRPRRARAPAELVIETQVTEITGDQLRYRGYDAIELARERDFEEVAGLLWTGTLGDPGDHGSAGDAVDPGQPHAEARVVTTPWLATDAAVAAGSAAQAALPAGTLPLERLQVIVPALAAADPLRLHLDPPAVIAAGRGLIAGMADSLPPAAPPALPAAAPRAARGARIPSGTSIAERLAARLCPSDPGPGLLGALRAAMVLLADHELAASTLAARVAASMRADPYAVVATGLGAVGGALHGGASFGAEVMLRSAAGPEEAARVVGDLLRRGERIPGFGHFVYRGSDPRAVLLMELLRHAAPGSERLAVADAVIAEAGRRALPEPNIDFALAALASVAGMVPGGGEAVFAVARTAGWLAHALEEYARGTPIRPRGVYTGPAWAPR
ncbi:MAG TPA: citrate/2-methylcitrate synthase [Streptosporangiaceae bacterium]